MFDILCTADDIASTLSHQTTLFMMWYPLHALHHTPVSDIAPTVSLSSQPLHWCNTHFWMTSHPPSLWHPMPYIEHHILSLCHHSTVLMTSQPLYLKAHPVCRATYIVTRHFPTLLYEQLPILKLLTVLVNWDMTCRMGQQMYHEVIIHGTSKMMFQNRLSLVYWWFMILKISDKKGFRSKLIQMSLTIELRFQKT